MTVPPDTGRTGTASDTDQERGIPIQLPRVRSLTQFQDGMQQEPSVNFSLTFGRVRKGKNRKELHTETSMNVVRRSLGLYQDYPLANSLLAGAKLREKSLKQNGIKQINHPRGTDGWWRSVFVIEVRAMDNYFQVWAILCFNALLATLLREVGGYDMSKAKLDHWDTIFKLALQTSLAFLLVFRLNRVAIRFWETRTMWGNLTHNTRNLVGGILLHCHHSPHYRDLAIRWAGSFCVAAKHFIRSEREISVDELAGVLTRNDIEKMQDANHAPLYSASMIRYYLRKALTVHKPDLPPHLGYAYAIQMNHLEQLIDSMVAQVSGMERVRSTPLPIVYVTHLRTFLFTYLGVLPYVYVAEWGWMTLPLVGFAAFALLGIEGASSECEIPFSKERSNHLAMDAYCLVMLDAVQGLVVHDANLDMLERQNDMD